MKTNRGEFKLSDQCGVFKCTRKATTTIPFKGKQFPVCALCREVIMAKVGDNMKKAGA